MLGSTFGISDTATQNRVLEYLQKLEEATYAGDEEAAENLEKQIAEAAKGNDQTMSIQEKMSLAMDKSVIIAQDQLANQKGILTATLMGLKNKEGKEGEDAFIANFGKAMNDLGGLLSGNKDITGMSNEELEKYRTDRINEIERQAKRYTQIKDKEASMPPESTAGASGAGSGRSSVSSGANPNNIIDMTVTVNNKTDSEVDIETGVGGSTTIRAKKKGK